jgi:hypothetical protein
MQETRIASTLGSRLDGHVRRRFGAWLLVGALVAVACSSRAPDAPQPTQGAGGQQGQPDEAPTRGPAPTQGPDVPPPSASPGEIVATIDGVSLTVRVDPNPAPRGEDVTFLAELRNDRATAVDYSPGGCAFADLLATFPVPWHPTGRTWTGRAGEFKDFALNNAYAPGAVPAWAPIDAVLLSTPCDESTAGEALLEAGEVQAADFSRAVGNALRTYSHTSAMTFSITASIDRQNDPPTIEPGYTGFPPRFFPIYLNLTATGVLAVEGLAADPLTAGEAIDALLDDIRFRTWLNDQPEGTCQTANLFLDNPLALDGDVVWIIDLFCESGVPRHFAFGWVDAETGEIRRLDICDDPCDR